jgi:hypothetical protein
MGFSYCPGNPDGCTSSNSCYAISRDKMSELQLQMLDALVLVKGETCYLCDGWDSHDLSVLDQDGSQTTYAGPTCTCTGTGSASDAVISKEFFNSFPTDGLEVCRFVETRAA